MSFHSVLTEHPAGSDSGSAPNFFHDLNLGQIVDAITLGKDEYNLKPFFYAQLHDLDAIAYRHEVMSDLENTPAFGHVTEFAQKMRAMREHLLQESKLHYKHQKTAWFLDAADIYCEAVRCLSNALESVALASRGLVEFREYLADYIASARFTSLTEETKALKSDLGSIRYSMLIKGVSVKVSKYESEIDYSADVEKAFERFKQGAVKDYRVKYSNPDEMNHVEAAILDLVAKLYPDIFASLERFREANADYLDATIGAFDREIQFYIAYLEFIATFRQKGLPFCYPKISETNKEIHNYGGFDLSLAIKLAKDNRQVVPNDFHLRGKERIIVVSGPNQGGKSTFARAFGQMHYLACLGCPVPGHDAQLFLFDQLFTHFEREEDIETLRGKLQDDLERMHDILKQATPDSIVIMNEIFTSTTLKDAIILGTKILNSLMQLDLLCVCVTFIDEWSSLSQKTVSMVSTVMPDNPAVRTFHIERKPADGLAYAISLAEKHRLTYENIKERVRS